MGMKLWRRAGLLPLCLALSAAAACSSGGKGDRPVDIPDAALADAALPDASDGVWCDAAQFAPRCAEGALEICEDSRLRRIDCEPGEVCEGDGCRAVEEGESCTPQSFADFCDGEGRQWRCAEGTVSVRDCPVGEVCRMGQCLGRADGGPEAPYCGDGVTDAPEEVCDDGELNGTYGHCRTDCQSVRGCGDGVVEEGLEECDDGELNSPLSVCGTNCRKNAAVFPGYPAPDTIPADALTSTPACVRDDLFAKYMHYRERFLGSAAKRIPGFVSWGERSGESIPASWRDPESSCTQRWNLTPCGFDDYQDAAGVYDWGDSTIWLGMMLHWLATEYAVFEHLGIDTSETLRYLVQGMKAFDRLDRVAETYFGFMEKLDGFFVRSDVPKTFALNSDGTYRFPRTDGAYAAYECTYSGASCSLSQGMSAQELLDGGVFESQDQVTGLLEGYAMVAALVPGDVVVDGIRIREHARETVHRLVWFLKNSGWAVRAPNGHQPPADWGGNAVFFSGMFAAAAEQICGRDFLAENENYQDNVSQLMLDGFTAAVGLTWGLWQTTNNYNRNLIFRLAAIVKDVWPVSSKLTQMAVNDGRDIFAMYGSVLHGERMADDFSFWRIHSLLRQAPCSGPCNVGQECEYVSGWRGENYFVSPLDRFGSNHQSAEYNGLDYLMAHNLYFLAYLQRYGRPYTNAYGKLPASEDGACAGKVTLDGMRAGQAAPETYDMSDPCHGRDLAVPFCGRPWGDWLMGTARGENSVFAGGRRWTCTSKGQCTTEPAALQGYTSGDDLILGTDADDVLMGGAGSDCIYGFGGDDDISAGNGNNEVHAGEGNDRVTAGSGVNFIDGGDGSDVIRTGGGSNMVWGGSGDDDITTGGGNDLIDTGTGSDTVRAGDGVNTIQAGDGDKLIIGGAHKDVVFLHSGNSKLKLGEGSNEVSHLGSGSLFVLAGSGDDKCTSQKKNPAGGKTNKGYYCLGEGRNTVWGEWAGVDFCGPGGQLEGGGCQQSLEASFCTEENFDAWTW